MCITISRFGIKSGGQWPDFFHQPPQAWKACPTSCFTFAGRPHVARYPKQLQISGFFFKEQWVCIYYFCNLDAFQTRERYERPGLVGRKPHRNFLCSYLNFQDANCASCTIFTRINVPRLGLWLPDVKLVIWAPSLDGLDDEICRLTLTLVKNGFPTHVIDYLREKWCMTRVKHHFDLINITGHCLITF